MGMHRPSQSKQKVELHLIKSVTFPVITLLDLTLSKGMLGSLII